MHISIQGAREHNLQNIDVEIGEGLTVVTGVSGSGKTSLVFDTLYHEARRRFLETFTLGSAASRLAPANVREITGLGPAVAVGQNLLNRNPNSILATAAGLHPFLRLLFANFGERACPRCGKPVTVYSDDQILEILVRTSAYSALNLSLPLVNGLSGSHRTLLKALRQQFGIESLVVDGQGWDGELPDPHAPHSISLRLADWEGPASTGQAREIVEKAAALGGNTLAVQSDQGLQLLSRAPVCASCGAWLQEIRAIHFHQACQECAGRGCPDCAGTGLPRQAAFVVWEGLRLPEMLCLSVDEAAELFGRIKKTAQVRRLQDEIERRLDALQRVGLGYLSLDRPSTSLSRGEAQRVRLAVALISRLEDMLHVLDEPTVGQHPADVLRLLPVFRDLAGPVVFVEHDRSAAAQADWAVDLGPGAGHQGGRVVFTGKPAGLWQAETATGRYFSLRSLPDAPEHRPPPARFLNIRGASLRNLRGIDIPIPLERLTVVTGVSGSGKSTLVEDVLVASLEAKQPVGCEALEGPSLKAVMVDQSPIGRNPRSNPATYTKLADIIRDLFANVTGLAPSYFSFNRPEGACPTCSGLGAVEMAMRYLPPTWIPCADCGGERFTEQVLAAKIEFGGQRLSIADFYQLSIAEAGELFQSETRLPAASRLAGQRILEALCDIGLGYLELGQPSPTLSGGEAQRVKLARYLGLKSLSKQLLVLDEPSTGLHPQDLAGLLTVLDRLVRLGATVVIVEHNTDVIRAADWVVDLGPGAGPKGGALVYAGLVTGMATAASSATAQALEAEAGLVPHITPQPGEYTRAANISIRQAHAHNLKNVDVEFPKGVLTVVTGVSGSGKSSLVSDVLEAEARRRFLETLSLYERQGTHEGPEAEVDSVSGLGVALTVSPERLAYSRRATVGTATEVSHHLGILLATHGERSCLQCGEQMERGRESWHCPACQAEAPLAKPQHFNSGTYSAACLKCNGVGSMQKPQPKKLILHPEKPLVEGAMYSPGFFPNGYLGKPFNHGYYLVLALGEHFGFDPHHTPWQEMSPQAQQAFLFGCEESLQVTIHSRKGITSVREQKFPGFYGFIRDWDVGGTYTDTVACPECGGRRLRPEYLAVSLAGQNIYQMSQMPLFELATRLEKVTLAQGAEGLASGSLRKICQRLKFLTQVGLGYLHLDRVAGTLSAGEVQRIRLAGLLGSGLTALTLLVDEPTRGLHPVEVAALLEAFRGLCQEGNTLIVVEHDPQVIEAADYLIDVGPEAGAAGGQVVARGTPEELRKANTLTARWLRGEIRMEVPRAPRTTQDWLTVYGARANNLKNETVRFPLHGLVGICGVSGSGKSTLMVDTLGRALSPRKQTTSVAYAPVDPGEHDRIEGAPQRTILVDQSKSGIGSPAGFLGLEPILRSIFASSEDARSLGLVEDQLARHCTVCGGSGVITLDMAFLPNVHTYCETCQGSGFMPEAWQVRVQGLALPEVYGLTLAQVYDLFGDDERLAEPLLAAQAVGLGYLVLRQPGYALSGGEAQRLKIVEELRRKSPPDTLYILDEPSLGQHLQDVKRLVGVLYRLVDEGGSVFVVEHHAHLLACCDWLVELGPEGGPGGGWVIASGTPGSLAQGKTPTAPYLRAVLEGHI